MLRKALELYRQMNVKDGELLAQCYSKIARCMAKNGTSTKALELSEQALQMREKMREKEPFKYAACCHDRAGKANDQGLKGILGTRDLTEIP